MMVRTDGDLLPEHGGTAPADFDDWDLRRHLGVTHHELEHARTAVGEHPDKLRHFLADRAEPA